MGASAPLLCIVATFAVRAQTQRRASVAQFLFSGSRLAIRRAFTLANSIQFWANFWPNSIDTHTVWTLRPRGPFVRHYRLLREKDGASCRNQSRVTINVSFGGASARFSSCSSQG